MTLVKDPLLAAARILLIFFIVVLGFAAAAVAIAAPTIVVFHDRVIAAFVAEGATDAARLFPSLPILMLGIAGLLALGVYFLVLLRRIVASVGEGDPFIPDNATRLSRMGWIALAGQVVSIPLGAAVVWVARIVEDDPKVRVDEFGFSASGILLVLILFILARVFRRGAEMREELEGTV
jgi:hypothetical protein